MPFAALTCVYNEAFNLPIWLRHYGALFGPANLYVLDHGSTDGSTDALAEINLVRIPRTALDEAERTQILSDYQAALSARYDAVIVADADELLAPDPAHFADLNAYLAQCELPYVNAIGIDLLQMLDRELPYDPSRPILSQRSIGRFNAPMCKQLATRIPVRWSAGRHSSDQPPIFDTRLFNFHIKLIDYAASVARQQLIRTMPWSESSLAHGLGEHQRWPLQRFVYQSFFLPMEVIRAQGLAPFEFHADVHALATRTALDPAGFHIVPSDVSKFVAIPERFRAVL